MAAGGRAKGWAVLVAALATPLLVHLASAAGWGGSALRDGLAVAAGLSHGFVFGGLFLLFAGTLRPGREPLASAMARRLRGPLPPEIERYTRRVTLAWAIFFAAQLLGSAVLFALAPRPVWLAFVTVFDLPLVLGMFGLEYLWRRLRYRGHTHSGPRAMLRAFPTRRAGW